MTMNDMLRVFDDVGEHGHKILRNENATNSSGSHMHVWAVMEEFEVGESKIPEGSLIISSYDGAHDHDLSQDGMSIEAGGEHRHGVRVAGRSMGTSRGGAHDHLVLVHKTGFGGPHMHELVINGMSMMSLGVADFLRMLSDNEGEGEMDDEEIEMSLKSDPGCVHTTEAERVACAVAAMLERTTGRQVFGGPHNEGMPFVAKSRDPRRPGVNDRMLGALGKLADE